MSFQAMTWAIEQKAGSPVAKALLLSIANYADANGTCFTSQAVFAAEAELSVDSVQRWQKELIGRGLLRKIWLRVHGRNTSDFLILSRSPLFSASLEEIKPYLPAGRTPVRDSNDQAAACGHVENGASEGSERPQTAAESVESENQAATCGPVESGDQAATGTSPSRTGAATEDPRLNQESPNPKSLSPERAPASEASPPIGAEGEVPPSQSPSDPPDTPDSPEMQKLWSKFCSAYPEGVLDIDKAEAAFRKLPLSEASDCVHGVELYADRCKRLRQPKPMRAHLFIRKRTYSGLLAEKPTTKRAVNFTLVPFNSKRGRAIANLYLMTPQGEPVRCHGDGGLECYSVPFAPNDQIMAFADIQRRSLWKFYPLSMKQKYAAWGDFIQAHTGKQLRTTPKGSPPGFYAPHPWPPRIDGTWSESPESPPSTGPPSVPKIPELTEDDIDAFTHGLVE